jgi:hypothetical protein
LCGCHLEKSAPLQPIGLNPLMDPNQIRLDELPKYRAAVELEGRIRAEAFDDDLPEFICGIEVQPLNLTHLLRLEAIKSPFVCGGRIPEKDDVLVFLWAISPDYAAAILFRNKLRSFLPRFTEWMFNRVRARFARKLRRKSIIEFIGAIVSYLNEAYQDSPGSGQSGFRAPFYCGPTGLVSNLARELHWSESALLRMPIKRIFQYDRCLALQKNENTILFNPSDKVRREEIQQMLASN